MLNFNWKDAYYLQKEEVVMIAYFLRTLRICGWLLFELISTSNLTYADTINFEDATVSSGINYAGVSYGCTWGDLNTDGWPDLWTCNHAKKPSLYLNNGDGTFTNVVNFVETITGDMHGGAWADFDNDGDQDLLVLLGGGGGGGREPNLFFINSNSVLQEKAVDYGLDYSLGRGRTPLWFDWNSDGNLDVFISNTKRSDGEAPSALFTRQDGNFIIDNSLTNFATSNSNLFAQLTTLTFQDIPAMVVHSTWPSFPDKVYEYDTLPFQELIETVNFPLLKNVLDTAVADFDGNLLTDFYSVTARGKSMQVQPDDAMLLTNIHIFKNEKGILFSTEGNVNFQIEPGYSIQPSDIYIGSAGAHPATLSFTLSSTNADAVGIFPHMPGVDFGLYIGIEPESGLWQLFVSKDGFASLNFLINADAPISLPETIGFESSDGKLADSLFLQTKDGFREATAVSRVDVPTAGRAVVAADFDNDMDVDLYIVCSNTVTNLPNILYENRGDGTFQIVSEAGGAEGSPVGRGENVTAVDYDRDGFVDLFVTNGLGAKPFNNGPSQLFRNTGNSNHWLEIDLEGVVSNRDGIGTRLLATSGGVTQLREQSGGMHKYAQNHQRVHFGLGDNTTVDQLIVKWPSGMVQEIHDIPSDQIIRVVETSLPNVRGKPAYTQGQDAGVYLWKDTWDGLYHLRVSGNGPVSVFNVEILADKPFTRVVPINIEDNDDFFWDDNYMSFTSRVTTFEDGIDFALPPGTEALIAVELDGYPNPRQLHVGNRGQPLTPVGWVLDVGQFPAMPNFSPGEELGLFVGIGSVPGAILARWNGDGQLHTAALKVVASKGFQDVQTVSFEPCCDALVIEDFVSDASATMDTSWDGLNIQVPVDSTMGISYHQDGLFQMHRVNGVTRNLGRANAYALPSADILGSPIYNSAYDKGIFIWRIESGVLKFRVTAGGGSGRYDGAIVSTLPIVSADGVALESDDVLKTSEDKTRVEFTLHVVNSGQDGIDIELPSGAEVSLELNGNTVEAARLVQVGGDRWRIESLPVMLTK